ncbi:hypothetical protein KSS87_000358 [Heliosperma pusillum]|nr:hypothetical protein KSS87_000358 [Heliosperma pusillum]
MSNEADATSPEFSAETVGRAFVSQFYQILHHSPERVYCFYNDQSTMSRSGPTGDLVTATSMDGIKVLILELGCKNYNIEILTADAQASYENGVTVLVTGCLTGEDDVRRKFTESFFLAPQDSGYFVLNNTFRFIDEIRFPVKDSVEEHCDKIAPTTPISPRCAVALVQEMAEVTDNSLGNHTAVVADIEEATEVPLDQQKSSSMEKAVPQPSTDSSHNVQSDVNASSNGDVDAPKKSYASLLMNGKQGNSILPNHAPAKRNIAPRSVRPAGQQTQAATVPTAATPTAATEFSAANGSNNGKGHASSNGHVAGKGHSIYIGHLPYDATPELVEREFKKFGRIKKNGIQVRSNKGYVFGFVEYEDASAQENALKDREGGRQANELEEAGLESGAGDDGEVAGAAAAVMVVVVLVWVDFRVEESTGWRVDDYTVGRGGYRNDGYRRGNYSNGRGYARNDYGKRSGEGPARGFVDQNGGGRGARQEVGPK